MGASKASFTLFKNRYNGLKFEVLGGVSDLSGEGWAATWTFSQDPGASGGNILINKSSADPTEITFTDNYVYVDILPANTSSIDAGINYYQELTLQDNVGNKRVASYGDARIVRETTDLS